MAADAPAAVGLRPIPCDEVLRIAQRDAEIAYHDLAGYRIVMTMEGDSWHVDYELREQLVAGGGPHYVVDRFTGQILSKQYQQ